MHLRVAFLITCFLLLHGFCLHATHIFGAEITASVKSCQANTYDIIISVYADPGADVDFGSGILSLGFGEPIHLSTEQDFITLKVVEYDDQLFNVGELVVHDVSFPGPGAYVLTFREFNRTADVVNMLNSVNTPVYTESKLVVDPLLCNSTPQLSDSVSRVAYTGSTFLQHLLASDPDGDSLSVELVTPQQDLDVAVDFYVSPLDVDLRYAENPTNAEGTGLPTLTVSPKVLVWDAPNLPGAFALALRVHEWRQVNGEWQSLGYVTRDFTVQVLDTVNGLSHTDIPHLITATNDEVASPPLQLYPNPAQEGFTLEVNDDTWRGASASIHNIIGQELDQRTVTLGKNAYYIAAYQPGTYILTLRQGEFQKVLRFVKR